MSIVELEQTALAGMSEGLPDELLDLLAGLDATPGVAELAIASLRYGSRRALAAYGVIEPIPDRFDEGTNIVITAQGRALIAYCARMRAPSAEEQARAEASLAHAREVYRSQPATSGGQ